MTHVFLTGATGFLGAHLLRELQSAGCTVHALSRRPESDVHLEALGAKPVRAVLSDVDSLKRALQGCSAVFHAAADTSMWRPQAAAQTHTNVHGTENLLQAAQRAGVSAFIHTSSVSAYSHLTKDAIIENTLQRGAESWINYERSKYFSEQAVRQSSLPWVILQPTHILGPGDRRNWARLIMLIDQQKLPGIPPGIGSFADVRHIARAHVTAWQMQKWGETYLLGGEHVSFVEFVHHVGAILCKRTPTKALPAWLLMSVAQVAYRWSLLSRTEPDITPESAALTCHQLHVDSSKAIKQLDYAITPFKTLLNDTINWLKQEKMIGLNRL
jgi:nucleoside-diphosphate-sugar epimerase